MLNFEPLPHVYQHVLNSNQLPEYVYDVLYEQAVSNDHLIDYCDGDFKVPTSWERLEKEFKAFYLECQEDDPESENEFETFLNSFPAPYKETDVMFLIAFYQ